MDSPGVVSNRFGPLHSGPGGWDPIYFQVRGNSPAERPERMQFADHCPRRPLPAARRGAPLAELPTTSMEGIRGPG